MTKESDQLYGYEVRALAERMSHTPEIRNPGPGQPAQVGCTACGAMSESVSAELAERTIHSADSVVRSGLGKVCPKAPPVSVHLFTTENLGDHGREVQIALEAERHTTVQELLQRATTGYRRLAPGDFITIRLVEQTAPIGPTNPDPWS